MNNLLDGMFDSPMTQLDRIEEKLNWLVDNMQAKKKRKPAQKKEAPDTFNLFWKAYPRKQGKADAVKAWLSIKANDKLIHDIMIDLKHKIDADIQWQDKQYIPLPASYLRGEKWNDEINPIPVKAPTLPKNDDDLESWSIEHGYGSAPIGLTYDQFRRHLQTKLNGE